MKRLFLVRHAKSSWEQPGVSDLERPLLPKGVKKTDLVVDFLLKRNVSADLMISSPALRALETARIIAQGLHYPIEKIRIDRRIYEGPYDRVLDVIYETPDEASSLMIFGHNPVITQLANLFLHPGIDNMPTSCIVCINFETDAWEKIPDSRFSEEFVAFPGMLK